MTTLNFSQTGPRAMPPALGRATRAMELPEVQTMLRRLSEFDLGIFMPHQHDEETGEFLPLADQVVQVESACKVSFQRADSLTNQADRFPAVAWIWRAGAPTPAAVCEMDSDAEELLSPDCYIKHKMISKNM